MAFISLPDALAQLNMKESELRKLIQKKGFQVYMSGQDDKGKKVICFQEEDIRALAKEMGIGVDSAGESSLFDMNAGSSLRTEALNVEKPVFNIEESSANLGAAEIADDKSPELENLDMDSSSANLDIELSSTPEPDMDIDLDGPLSAPGDSASLDLDLDVSAADSLHLDFDDTIGNTLEEVATNNGKGAKKAPVLDNTIDIDPAGKDNLSFEADDTLSIGDEDATLEFESEHLALPEESFSVEDGETLSGTKGDLSLDDESLNGGSLAEEEGAEDGAARPTTEIIDEDNVPVVFPVAAFFCFAIIIFNGCVLFGLVQDSNLEGGISYGQSFYASIRDFTASNFNLPH